MKDEVKSRIHHTEHHAAQLFAMDQATSKVIQNPGTKHLMLMPEDLKLALLGIWISR